MNVCQIQIGVIGSIKEGSSKGWFLLIKDDFQESGGYLILISKDREMSKYDEGYDYWAEDKKMLVDFFISFKWEIDWLENQIEQ